MVTGIDYAAIAKAGGLSKGEPRKRTKARKDRADDKAKAAVRVKVFARDSGCRAGAWGTLGPCAGPLTLAHLLKQSATRNQAPDVRHNAANCVALCQRHHMMEEGKDRPRIAWSFLSESNANGPMSWSIAR